ncbi:AMP-dependent synthetase and ligase [Novosphingobium aromaticivorans DSM 12444]|uniref:AMP-dependent synthetase and ligase n=2 Tax=Novosphingobium aromaticivorans TaxID=48935 RepID=Q2GB07_NOVAD|nr:AMP-dependent synthetase and ligase [Novosphingobium aromaticivorans DSM 12444]SCY86295.1 fatty-acyl-CoA synthase [Novosphingobium aromaticivorans]
MYATSADERRHAIAVRHPAWIWNNLHSYLDWSLGDLADRPLVIADEGTLTYGDAARLSVELAGGLKARGIKKGERVGLIMANDPLTVPLLFAIWRAGAIAVPLNTLYRPDEIRFALAEAGCALLIAMDRFASRNFAQELEEGLPGWQAGACHDLPELRGGLIFDRAAPGRLVEKLSGQGGGAEDHERVEGGDTALILFTSGTTGSPKGVEISHDNLLRAMYAGAYHQAFEDGRRAVFSLPLYHGFGLVVGLLSGMVSGGAIIPLLRFDPHQILAATERHRATYLMGVPTMTIALLEQAKRQHYDLSSLNAIHSAAAPTPSWVWEDIRATFGCEEIITSYGQTEVTATVICTAPGDSIETVSETQGRIVEAGIAGMPDQGGRIAEFKIIDPETGADLPWGASGELCCRSPMNSKGYFRRPKATAALFLEGGWIRMGDLGQFRPDGNLFLTGRTKELYKSKGELVSPKELEQILTANPGVSQAFFIGMPDDQFGECGCAWVVRAEGSGICEGEVMDYLRERIPAYKMPREVWFIEDEALPKTGTGKVQKAELRNMALAMLADQKAV